MLIYEQRHKQLYPLRADIKEYLIICIYVAKNLVCIHFICSSKADTGCYASWTSDTIGLDSIANDNSISETLNDATSQKLKPILQKLLQNWYICVKQNWRAKWISFCTLMDIFSPEFAHAWFIFKSLFLKISYWGYLSVLPSTNLCQFMSFSSAADIFNLWLCSIFIHDCAYILIKQKLSNG